MRFADRLAAVLVCIFGIAHLAVGHAVFIEPNEPRIWFASAGLLLLVSGLTNLGAENQGTRMQSFAAAVGGVSILMIGTLLALANPDLMFQPQTLALLALGLFLTARRLREVLARNAV